MTTPPADHIRGFYHSHCPLSPELLYLNLKTMHGHCCETVVRSGGDDDFEDFKNDGMFSFTYKAGVVFLVRDNGRGVEAIC